MVQKNREEGVPRNLIIIQERSREIRLLHHTYYYVVIIIHRVFILNFYNSKDNFEIWRLTCFPSECRKWRLNSQPASGSRSYHKFLLLIIKVLFEIYIPYRSIEPHLTFKVCLKILFCPLLTVKYGL